MTLYDFLSNGISSQQALGLMAMFHFGTLTQQQTSDIITAAGGDATTISDFAAVRTEIQAANIRIEEVSGIFEGVEAGWWTDEAEFKNLLGIT